MIYANNMPNNLFLFNPQHMDFIQGESAVPSSVMTPSQATRYFLTLLLLIALPTCLIISLLISLTGRNIFVLLPIELVVAVVSCGFVAFMGFRYDRELIQSGKVIIGEIVESDSRPAISIPSERKITRMKYRFSTPDNKHVVKTISLSYSRYHLPDGRRFPEVGTKIAVLYADSRHLRLL